MVPRNNLTIDEIRAMLQANLGMREATSKRLGKQINEILERTPKEEDPKAALVKQKVYFLASDIIARRLKRNRRAVPLISKQDFNAISRSISASFLEGEDLNAEEKKFFEKLMGSVMGNVFEIAECLHKDKDPYGRYWQWIRTVVELAHEKELTPSEFLALEESSDEIVRRLYTKREYRALQMRKVTAFTSARAMKRMFVQPRIEATAAVEGGLSREEYRELKEEIEEELMPQLKVEILLVRTAARRAILQEATRIYG